MSSSSSEVVRKELDEEEESEALPSSSLSSSEEDAEEEADLPLPFDGAAGVEETDFAAEGAVAILEVEATGWRRDESGNRGCQRTTSTKYHSSIVSESWLLYCTCHLVCPGLHFSK